jgi:hypothetical protein
MKATYQYTTRKRQGIGHFLLRATGVTAVVAGVLVGLFILFNHYQPKHKVVVGKAVSVPQLVTTTPVITIKEPTYTIQLPSDWVQVASEDVPNDHSVTWQATAKYYDDRILQIYVDSSPTTFPVNAELPIQPNGNRLTVGTLSQNCSDFTPGGTQNTVQAETLPPKETEWDSVNFMCDLARFTDNQIGTGTVGSPINTTTITGPTKGTHTYFFLFSDRNINPDETILYNALDSFRAL